MTVSFTIPGQIGGKGRPKFARRGNFVSAYTPEKTRNTEAMMRDLAQQAMEGRAPLQGPVALAMTVWRIPPPSWSKKKRETARYVTGKPDPDNTLKLCDAFNGVVWLDDAQVSVVSFSREYTLLGPERCEVTITPLSEARA